ncbi:MAG: hypothetical protein CL858_24480 [Cupriavidus sp.]|nr:hypothetical protein [Cupriavidus sp.]
MEAPVLAFAIFTNWTTPSTHVPTTYAGVFVAAYAFATPVSVRMTRCLPIALTALVTWLNEFFWGVSPPARTRFTNSIITEFSHSAGRIVAGKLVAGLPSVKKPAVPAGVEAGWLVAAVALSIWYM